MATDTLLVSDKSAVTGKELLSVLRAIRRIDLVIEESSSTVNTLNHSLLAQISNLQAMLQSRGNIPEADTLNELLVKLYASKSEGGLGLTKHSDVDEATEQEVLFLFKAHLMALSSAEKAYSPCPPLLLRPEGRRPMTMSEKILMYHSTSPLSTIRPGDVVTIHVDWIIASELSWYGMSKVYDNLLANVPKHNNVSNSKIFRNDRLWIAGDHLVTSNNRTRLPYSTYVSSAEKARRDFSMTEYQGMNYTIMHTEFVRSRALPGQLVVGSDSHTCSAGAVGSLALGLGTDDVVMPLITGQTWIRVPECIRIDFVGKPPVGIGGKDVILHILGELGRNTIAQERIVEFSGDGTKYLSTDARFAICNMCAEFGAVTGLFVPDEQTMAYVSDRKRKRDREGAVYFKPDPDAEYAKTFQIDLGKVESTIARYPKPDDVLPVRTMAGLELDGCFIGACTTAEEDLKLAALVLEAGLNRGLLPVGRGKRKVIPGSVPIRLKLDQLGLSEIFHRASFEIGEPSCSYCVGLSEDKALEGEVWLSSQNRNFENRMGPGSIGHITSAVVVAASSFGMNVTDPRDLITAIPAQRFKAVGLSQVVSTSVVEPEYMEPGVENSTKGSLNPEETDHSRTVMSKPADEHTSAPSGSRKAPVQVLPPFVDTDALAPNESLATCHTPAEFAQYCLKYTHPSFRDRAKSGATIIVAGKAFGCGSSRQVAVTALLGCGIQAIIAPSFSFIFGRNAANLGLLCIIIDEKSGFYDAVGEGEDLEVEVKMDEMIVEVHKKGNEVKAFPFELSDMEKQLVECGGMTNAWKSYGMNLWDKMAGSGKSSQTDLKSMKLPPLEDEEVSVSKQNLKW